MTMTDLQLVRFTSFDERFNKAACVIEMNVLVNQTVNNQKSTFPTVTSYQLRSWRVKNWTVNQVQSENSSNNVAMFDILHIQ